MNLPMADRQGSTGAFARRVSEFESVRDFFASTTVVLAVDLTFLILFLGFITLIGGWLVLVPLAGITMMLIAGISLQRAMGKAALDAQADASLQHSVLVESIGGAETLKAARAEGQMLGRWRRYSAMSAATQERMRRLTAVAVNLASISQQTISIGLLIGGFYQFQQGDMTMGAIIAIIMISGRSLQPVGQLAFLITRGKQAFATLTSLQKLMEAGDERQVAMRSIVPEIRAGHIEMRGVSFRYPNAARDSLSDINFKIDPGERIGIIGRVASGKSTLGRVLSGLYPPTSGEMLVDGLDSRQYHPHQLRDAFRFVAQDAEVFSGTVRDNLMLGAAQADDQAADRRRGALGRRHLPVARRSRFRPARRRAWHAPVGRAAVAAGPGSRPRQPFEAVVPRRADRLDGHADRALFHRTAKGGADAGPGARRRYSSPQHAVDPRPPDRHRRRQDHRRRPARRGARPPHGRGCRCPRGRSREARAEAWRRSPLPWP